MKKFNVNVGGRTFKVSAKDSTAAVNAVKAHLADTDKTVAYSEYRKELDKAPRSQNVRIYELGLPSDKTIHLGVNWSALGTTKPAEAESFIKELQKAIEFCKKFKYDGYKYYYDKD